MLECKKQFILEGIDFILKHNKFIFNNQVYIPSQGHSYGDKICAYIFQSVHG